MFTSRIPTGNRLRVRTNENGLNIIWVGGGVAGAAGAAAAAADDHSAVQ